MSYAPVHDAVQVYKFAKDWDENGLAAALEEWPPAHKVSDAYNVLKDIDENGLEGLLDLDFVKNSKVYQKAKDIKEGYTKLCKALEDGSFLCSLQKALAKKLKKKLKEKGKKFFKNSVVKLLKKYLIMRIRKVVSKQVKKVLRAVKHAALVLAGSVCSETSCKELEDEVDEAVEDSVDEVEEDLENGEDVEDLVDDVSEDADDIAEQLADEVSEEATKVADAAGDAAEEGGEAVEAAEDAAEEAVEDAGEDAIEDAAVDAGLGEVGLLVVGVQIHGFIKGTEAKVLHKWANDIGGWFGWILNGYADMLGFIADVTGWVTEAVMKVCKFTVVKTLRYLTPMGWIYGIMKKSRKKRTLEMTKGGIQYFPAIPGPKDIYPLLKSTEMEGMSLLDMAVEFPYNPWGSKFLILPRAVALFGDGSTSILTMRGWVWVVGPMELNPDIPGESPPPPVTLPAIGMAVDFPVGCAPPRVAIVYANGLVTYFPGTSYGPPGQKQVDMQSLVQLTPGQPCQPGYNVLNQMQALLGQQPQPFSWCPGGIQNCHQSCCQPGQPGCQPPSCQPYGPCVLPPPYTRDSTIAFPDDGNPHFVLGNADGSVNYYNGTSLTQLQEPNGSPIVRVEAQFPDAAGGGLQVVVLYINGVVNYYAEGQWTQLNGAGWGTAVCCALSVQFRASGQPEVVVACNNTDATYYDGSSWHWLHINPANLGPNVQPPPPDSLVPSPAFNLPPGPWQLPVGPGLPMQVKFAAASGAPRAPQVVLVAQQVDQRSGETTGAPFTMYFDSYRWNFLGIGTGIAELPDSQVRCAQISIQKYGPQILLGFYNGAVMYFPPSNFLPPPGQLVTSTCPRSASDCEYIPQGPNPPWIALNQGQEGTEKVNTLNAKFPDELPPFTSPPGHHLGNGFVQTMPEVVWGLGTYNDSS
uniref:Uncharacterized protein n=1 Tax=Eutreptiella gymnastica TaxID=73025 RepID=A0A7S4CHQ2_9EUGL